MARSYIYAGFGGPIEDVSATSPGGGLEVTVTPGKEPFYRAVDPVAAFLKAIQKVLGVPTTGVWDKATHDMYWAYVMARETMSTPGGISDMPPVLPYKSRVCVSDGFPRPENGADCVDTARLILDILDEGLEDPAFVSAMGWASQEAMFADTDWEAVRESFATKLIMHIQNKLTEGISPISPPEPTPPLPPVEPPPAQPEIKKAGVGWIVGGLLVLGGIGWLATRKTE